MVRDSLRLAADVVREKIDSIGLAPLLGLVTLLLIVGVASYYGYYAWLVLSENIGTFHTATDTADLDGDGDLDVILHNVRREAEFTAFGGPTLWINQGEGRFVPRAVEVTGGVGGGWASTAGDVDGDTDADLLLFIGYQLRLLLNQGGAPGGETGEFYSETVITPPRTEGQYGSLHLADLNQDDRPDAIITGCCGRVFTLDPEDDTPNFSWRWLNQWENGSRRGHSSSVAILPALQGLAVPAAALGDLDGDGDLDLFAGVIAPPEGRNRDPADRVIFNDGTGYFVDSGQRLGASDSTAVALGDLDGDRDLDTLVGTNKGATVWLNQGGAQGGQEGNFAAAEQRIAGGEIRTVLLSDLDGDGDPDALLGERTRATIWWNDGEGTFTRSARRFRYTKRHGLALADFDGDGRPDLFAAAYDDDYRIWLNQGHGTFR